MPAEPDNPVDLEPSVDALQRNEATGALAKRMEDGRGIAPSPSYPVGRAGPVEER